MSHANYTKADYDFMASKRRAAFISIANKLGKVHPITQLLGPLAWGRHPFEQGRDGNLRTAIREMSALDGMFYILNIWGRDHDRKAQTIMLNAYPQRFQSVPKEPGR